MNDMMIMIVRHGLNYGVCIQDPGMIFQVMGYFTGDRVHVTLLYYRVTRVVCTKMIVDRWGGRRTGIEKEREGGTRYGARM